MMFNFEPTETPLGYPVVAVFDVRDKVYVCDVYGTLYVLDTAGDSPSMWCWIEVMNL